MMIIYTNWFSILLVIKYYFYILSIVRRLLVLQSCVFFITVSHIAFRKIHHFLHVVPNSGNLLSVLANYAI